MATDNEFSGAQTEGNQYERNLLILLLDASGSMSTRYGQDGAASDRGLTRMDSLREGVTAFLTQDLPEIPAIRLRGELAIGIFYGASLRWITPGGTQTRPFVVYSPTLAPPELEVQGNSQTPLATAINEALGALEARKAELDREQISLEFKPMIFLITDGVPEPDSQRTALEATIKRLRPIAFPAERTKRKALFFAFGVTGADDALMTRLAPPSYYPLADTPLRHAMNFVSKAVGRITQPQGIGRDDYVAARDEVERARQELKDAYSRWTAE